uniref:Transmembrane protein n=1 Tax=Anopheles merus TaxID=30066 RepID=A0A182V2K9_ANOME
MVGLATDDMVVRTQQHQQPSPNRHLGGGQSEFPVFIPPRKRQTGKKTNHGNHIDHIVNIQVSGHVKFKSTNVRSAAWIASPSFGWVIFLLLLLLSRISFLWHGVVVLVRMF